MAALTENYLNVADFSIVCKSSAFVTFLNNCRTAVLAQSANLSVGGIAFYTAKTPGNNFHTYGLIARAVVWDGSNPASYTPVAPSLNPPFIVGPEYPLYADNVGGFNINPNTLTTPPADSTKIFSQSWNQAWPDTTKYVKIAGSGASAATEIDFVYIELNVFCKMAGIAKRADGSFELLASLSQTELTSLGLSDDYYSPSAIPSAADRGFQLSRASLDFDYTRYTLTSTTALDMGKVRTIKMNPWPEPAIPPFMSRASVAYEIGVPCPPVWKDDIASIALRSIASNSFESGLLSQDEILPPDPPKDLLNTSGKNNNESFLEAFKNDPRVRNLSIALLLLLIALILSLLSKK